MPVDLSAQMYALFEKNLKRAKLYFDEGAYLEAAAAYRRCATYMKKYARYAADGQIQAQRLKRARQYRELADRIESGRMAMPAAEEPVSSEDYEDDVAGLIHRSSVTWDDIGGLEDTKREIKTAYGLSLARKPAGVELRGWRNILFYGPPGTGKTLLAAATSRGLDATFFNVKVSDLLSKYFGQSTKLVSALYAAARKLAPSVVFLDEFESLSGQRGSDDSGAERRIVSTLLAELDGLAQKGDDRYVLTIAATNVPWLMDKAILSRFEKKIYIPLPDDEARRTILEIQLEAKGHKTRMPYDELVKRTAGFSGREIERLCQEAINQMVRAANPGLLRAVDDGKEAMADYQLRVRPLSGEDFDAAFAQVTPETTAADLAAFDRWRASLD